MGTKKIETPPVAEVISLVEARDEDGNLFLLLTIRLESGTLARIPIPEVQGLQMWGLLETALRNLGHSSTASFVTDDTHH